jgi:hypothetical protein
MKQNLNLSVSEMVGTPLCVASQDGQRVHDRIATALNAGSNVRVSFQNVSILTAAFLNAAIGQLYGSFTENQIRSRLKVTNIQPDDLALLKRVVATAQQYFKDPKGFNKSFRHTIWG